MGLPITATTADTVVSAPWRVVRAWRLPGEDDRLAICDGDGQTCRVVCVVPGHLVGHGYGNTLVKRLDEQDEANARLLAAAPQLRDALVGLVAWAARTGTDAAPCWGGARTALVALAAGADHGGKP